MNELMDREADVSRGQCAVNNVKIVSNINYEANLFSRNNNNNGNQQAIKNTSSNKLTDNSSNTSSKNTSTEKKPINRRFEILNQIGQGSYATVYRAINREDERMYAIKKINMVTDSTYLMNEIKIMSECEHQNIVRYLGSECSVKEVSILMEYCRGGSVKDVMKHLKCTLNFKQILVILRDVLSGIEYLHSKGKIHRDVKAANILLHEDGLAKLGDFGVSEPSDTSTMKQTITGTLLWLPPEVIEHKIDINHCLVIDIWSLGITIIEMADGQPPYSDIGDGAALNEIKDYSKPSPTFRDPLQWPELSDLLGLCLEKHASKRSSARELLGHKIFADHHISHEEISSLVNRVYFSPAKGPELESDLCRKSESLLVDICDHFAIYKDRRRKVIKVDMMIEMFRSLDASFKLKQASVKRKDDEMKKLRSELNLLDEKIVELSNQREILKKKLVDGRSRQDRLKHQIQTIDLRSLNGIKAG